ncbi:MAG: hypothetical protein EOP53_25915 [Sphingobacteriales bacterium]|nr:MAG: hypothetical protein EOP53_25915 [Sphingobacteriales bacterium]
MIGAILTMQGRLLKNPALISEVKFILILNVLTFTSFLLVAQKGQTNRDIPTTKPDTLFVIKKYCDCKNGGYQLVIAESKKNKTQKECDDYSYELLFSATYEQKLAVLKQLLSYSKDTSLCCAKVTSYHTRSNKFSNDVATKRYTLQVSALFNINLICFAQYSSYHYAPFPVLVDTSTNTEINFDQTRIEEVFNVYSVWLSAAEKSAFKSFTFPLNNSRFQWKFGDYSKEIIFTSLPYIWGWTSSRIGKPAK